MSHRHKGLAFICAEDFKFSLDVRIDGRSQGHFTAESRLFDL